DGAATHELNHACGDGGTEEGAAIKSANDACGELEFAGKSGANPVGVALGIAFGDGFAEKLAGAHGVEETLAGEWVHKSGRVSNQRPVLADYGALGKRRNLRRRKNVAVEARILRLEFLSANENLKMLSQFGLVVRSHAAANTYG